MLSLKNAVSEHCAGFSRHGRFSRTLLGLRPRVALCRSCSSPCAALSFSAASYRSSILRSF
eukprot:802301-Pleurochrysis_carterae.AAC.1